jgi:hypothetical protein
VTTDDTVFDLTPRTHARGTDPSTSRAAAAQLSDKRTMMRRLLLAYFVYGPLTAEEAADVCGYTAESGAWKRCSDLALHGLIDDTPLRRTGRSGRAQLVRAITDAGRKAIE